MFAIRSLLSFLFAMIWIPSTHATAFAQGAGVVANLVRSCNPGSDEMPSKKKASTSRNKKQFEIPATKPACIEIHQSALLVQELSQKIVRDLRWKVVDEQATEDFWNFSIAISADELVAYMKPAKELRVSWTSGRASVNVQTVELSGGYTRLLISAKFDGYGVQDDSFAPKHESWPLLSNGALEAQIAGAISEHFKAVH
jgi:hypothetical protein